MLTSIIFSNTDMSQGSLSSYPQKAMKTWEKTRGYTKGHISCTAITKSKPFNTKDFSV